MFAQLAILEYVQSIFLIPKLDLCRAWEQQITGNTELAERKQKKRNCLSKFCPSPPEKNDCCVSSDRAVHSECLNRFTDNETFCFVVHYLKIKN